MKVSAAAATELKTWLLGVLVGTSLLSQSGADNVLSSTVLCAGGGVALWVYCWMKEGTALVWQGATQQSRRSKMNWL